VFCQVSRVKEGAQGHQVLPVVQDPLDNLASKVLRVLQVLPDRPAQLEVKVNRVKEVHKETLVLLERFLVLRVQWVTLGRLVSKDCQEARGARVQQVLLVSLGSKDPLVSKAEQAQQVGALKNCISFISFSSLKKSDIVR
jgi:hypothetical protein